MRFTTTFIYTALVSLCCNAAAIRDVQIEERGYWRQVQIALNKFHQNANSVDYGAPVNRFTGRWQHFYGNPERFTRVYTYGDWCKFRLDTQYNETAQIPYRTPVGTMDCPDSHNITCMADDGTDVEWDTSDGAFRAFFCQW